MKKNKKLKPRFATIKGVPNKDGTYAFYFGCRNKAGESRKNISTF